MKLAKTAMAGIAVIAMGVCAPTRALGSETTKPTPSAAQASAVIACTVNSDNPHISSGSNVVIYKVRATCNGTGTLRVWGNLWGTVAVGPPGPGALRGTQDQRQAVRAGQLVTFYIPRTSTLVRCTPGLYYFGDWKARVDATGANTVSGTTKRFQLC